MAKRVLKMVTLVTVPKWQCYQTGQVCAILHSVTTQDENIWPPHNCHGHSGHCKLTAVAIQATAHTMLTYYTRREYLATTWPSWSIWPYEKLNDTDHCK